MFFFFFPTEFFFFFNSGEKGQEQKSCDYRNARLKQKEKKRGNFKIKKDAIVWSIPIKL